MRAWKFGDDVNTDLITPGRYTLTTDKSALRGIVFIECRPEFTKHVKAGDVVVAGRNFGCGSSREHAPIALKASGIGAIVAKSFARIFFRNAINIGLPVLICPEIDLIDDADTVEVNLGTGEILDLSKEIVLKAKPLPDFALKIVKKGGLVNFIRGGGYAQDSCASRRRHRTGSD